MQRKSVASGLVCFLIAAVEGYDIQAFGGEVFLTMSPVALAAGIIVFALAHPARPVV